MIIIPRRYLKIFWDEKWSHAWSARKSSSVYYRTNPGVKHFIRALKNEYWKSPPHILDLGCGDGRFSIKYAQAGFKVTGVDFSRQAIRCLLQRAKSFAYSSRIHGVVSDIVKYQYPRTRFEGVSCSNMLHYFRYRTIRKLAQKMKGTIKSGGCIYLAFETDIHMQTSDHRKFTFEDQYQLTLKQLDFVMKLFQDWELIFTSTTINRIRPFLPPSVQKLLTSNEDFYLRTFSITDFVFKKLN